jgi:hypothetical protein
MVEKVTPHFAYQLHFISGELEKVVHTKDDHKQFLVTLYGGRTEKREFSFDVHKGVDLELMRRVKPSWLLNDDVCSRHSKFCLIRQESAGLTRSPLTGTRILRLGIRPPRPAWTLYVLPFPDPITHHSNIANKNRNSKLVPHPQDQLRR